MLDRDLPILPNQGFASGIAEPQSHVDYVIGLPQFESGPSFEVAMPSPIAPKDIAAFKRAFRILGLEPPVEQTWYPTMCASKRDARTKHAADERAAVGPKARASEPWTPKLRMLLSTWMDGNE